jgi:hypothetical protein
MCFGQVKHEVAVLYEEHIKIYHPKKTYAGLLKGTSEWPSMPYASLSVLHGSNLNAHTMPHHKG